MEKSFKNGFGQNRAKKDFEAKATPNILKTVAFDRYYGHFCLQVNQMKVLREIKAIEAESNNRVIEAEKEKARKIEEAKKLADDIIRKAVEEAERQRLEIVKAAREEAMLEAREIERESQRKRKALTEKISKKKSAIKQKIFRGLLRVQA